MAYTTIKKPSDYFNTKLYTGNGSAGNAQTGVGFQPDWVWIKNRDVAYWHQTFDAVRGASSGTLYTNETSAEDYGGGNLLASFDSDGFTVNSNDGCNGNGEDLVAWNWLGANGTSANTDGSISSTVSANTTSGFSIVSYTGNGTSGATIGHSLAVKPSMIIVKSRDAAQHWRIYHSSLGATKMIRLSSDTGEITSSGEWNNTEPTNSLFTVGSDGSVNANTEGFIAYCFAEKKGFSKFGSYTGNGNADGTFVYTGFSPSFVMLKRTNTTGSWTMYDNKRHTYNPNGEYLLANTNGASVDFNNVDFLSNGFKLRDASFNNGSGDTIIYMCFAEAPLVGDNPCTAR